MTDLSSMDYQQRFNARLYEPGFLARVSRCFPERVRMWSPWWLRHVVAVERTHHEWTMDELRALDGHGIMCVSTNRGGAAPTAHPTAHKES